MDNVIQFQTRKQKTEKTRQEIYEEMAREGEALDNIQIIDVSPEESARGLVARMDALTLERSGSFWHANGTPLPW